MDNSTRAKNEKLLFIVRADEGREREITEGKTERRKVVDCFFRCKT